MGEDETSPKNRVALICSNCRLVNGQAPPGTKSLADLGKWRCFGCGGWNGEEDEGAKVVKEMKERIGTDPILSEGDEVLSEKEPSAQIKREAANATDDDSEGEDSVEEIVEITQPAKRGRPKGSRKKT